MIKYFLISCLVITTLLVNTALYAETDLGFKLKEIDKFTQLRTNSSIIQDTQGFIWIASKTGLIRYDSYESKFYTYKDVIQLIQDNQGGLWFISETQGLYQYNEKEDSFILRLGPEIISEYQCAICFDFLAVDINNNFWLGYYGGNLVKYSINNKSLEYFKLPHRTNSAQGHIVRPYISKEGKVFASYNKQLFLLEGANFVVYSLENNTEQKLAYITALAETNDGKLLVGTLKGLYVHDVKRHQTMHFLHDKNNKLSLSHNEIRSLFTASSGDIYIGTTKEINRLTLKTNTFNHQSEVMILNGKLPSNWVVQFYQDKQKNIWAINWDAAFILNPTQDNVSILKQKNSDHILAEQKNIMDSLVDKKNRLWFSTFGNGVFRRLGNNKFKQYATQFTTSGLTSNYTYQLFEDSRGDIWLGSEYGAFRYNEKIDSFEFVLLNPDIKQSELMIINSFSEQKNGLIHINTLEKWFLYDSVNNKVIFQQDDPIYLSLMTKSHGMLHVKGGELYLYKNNKLKLLPHFILNDIAKGDIVDLLQDRFGKIWVATQNGLYVSDQQGLNFQLLNFNGIVAKTPIASLLEGKQGHIWVVDNQAFYQINSTNLQTINSIPNIRGLSDAPQDEALAQDHNGVLYIGSTRGLISLNPKSKVTPLGLYITEVKVDSTILNTIQNQSLVSLTSDSMLEEQPSNIRFRFANLNYLNQFGTEYRFKLVGYDQEWQTNFSNEREAKYTNLDPGSYHFKVQSRLIHTPWVEVSLPFVITPPVYGTLWFKLVLSSLFLLVLYFFSRWKIQRLEYRNNQLQQQVEDRTSQVREQYCKIENLLKDKEKLYTRISHEFRTPLTVMQIPIKAMLDKKDKDQTQWFAAWCSGQRLIKMVEHLLLTSQQEEIEQAKTQNYEVKSDIEKIYQMFFVIAQKKNINMQLNIDVDTHNILLLEESLEQIIGNLLSNSLKYTLAGGEIILFVKQKGDVLVCKVTDTGVGIETAEQKKIFKRFHRINNPLIETVEGAGIGLSTVKYLVDHNSGEIQLTSELGKGSCFEVKLPITEGGEQKSNIIAQRHFEDGLTDIGVLENIEKSNQENENKNLKNTEKKSKVLIVEDNKQLRLMLQNQLNHFFDCITASNGQQGLLVAEKELPDLIISDIMMPEKNGFTLCYQLKNSQLTSHIPVILLTAKGSKQSRIDGWQVAADDYMNKPFEVENLRHRIDNLIEGRKKLQHFYQVRLFNRTPKSLNEVNSIQNKGDTTYSEKLSDTQIDPLLISLQKLVEINYSDSTFSTDEMASALFISSRQLQRKMQMIVNISPSEYLKKYRLKQAKSLLIKGHQASSVAYSIGFSSPAYFGACFKAEFNLTPKQFQSSAKLRSDLVQEKQLINDT
ncbi:hybrid sensor histidine kinase/response regulator transcription factor [Pseudoalteromonas denitrificans]|nr:hybrid sensor histidine kinase/response regulator transcription factor [Pseudoalteromonas denitrificans]